MRSGDSIAMETKMPKCNHAQMGFSNTSYGIDFIIIAISIINSAKYLFVDSTLAFVKYRTNRVRIDLIRDTSIYL